VQVHCDEGIANHIGPEPCAGIREDVGEASAGVRAGQPIRVLVQIGKPVEKFRISRIPYRVDRTAFHTAGAAASLRPSFERSNWPLRIRCVSSMPEIVVAALLNRLKPSMTFVLDLMWRWSWSGSSSALLRCCPLRTVRAPLGAYGSSLCKGICRHPVVQLHFPAYCGFLRQLRWLTWRLLAASVPPSVCFTICVTSQRVFIVMGC
jgi:hypothetical protein